MKIDIDAVSCELREGLWRWEILRDCGWFAYRNAVKFEKAKWPGKHECNFPVLTRTNKIPDITLQEVNGELRWVKHRWTKPPTRILSVLEKFYGQIDEYVRKLLTDEVLEQIGNSGLTNNDARIAAKKLTDMVSRAEAKQPIGLLCLKDDVLYRLLTTPIMINIQNPELSLFTRGGFAQIIPGEFADNVWKVRMGMRKLAVACAHNDAERKTDNLYGAHFLWLKLDAYFRNEWMSQPAYSPETARSIVSTLFEAVAAEWAQSNSWALSSATLPPEVVPYYYDIVKVYEPGKKIKLRDGTQLLNLDSTNPDLWKGIHDVLTKGDERGFCELPERWRRKQMRGGKKLSVGAKNVNKFLNHLEPEGRGRCGTRRYRIAR